MQRVLIPFTPSCVSLLPLLEAEWVMIFVDIGITCVNLLLPTTRQSDGPFMLGIRGPDDLVSACAGL